MDHMSGRRVSKYMMYKKARRMYHDISSRLTYLENRFLKNRHHHA